jgi:spermidine synthase
MKRDTNNSSAIFLNEDDLVYSYSQFVRFYSELKPDAKNFLMLGGGAYTIPRKVNQIDPDIQIDVVEIEPSLYELAIQYFDLPVTEKITNHSMDARVYLARTEEKYDVVFVDAYSTGFFVPSHLVTQEFFRLLKTRLNDDALVMINFIGTQGRKPSSSLTGSVNKTIESVFPNYLMFTTRDTQLEAPQNFMYIIRNSDSPIIISDLEKRSIRVPGKEIALSDLVVNIDSLSNIHDEVLTDNKSPVEVLVLKERFAY